MHFIKTTSRALLGASLTLGLAAASAAEPVGSLSRIEGFAFVSQGAQYVAAKEGMALKEGDRLMVMDGGNAIISFVDGCRYTLQDNEVLSLGATSTCAADTDGSYTIEPYTTVSQASPGASDSVRLAKAQVGGDTTPAWVAPTAAGLAIGGLVIAGATQDSDNDGDLRRAISRLPPSP